MVKMKAKHYYNKKSDSLYIVIKEGEEESFEKIAPGINLELDSKGEIIGVEILNASRFINREYEKKLPQKSIASSERI